MCFEACSLSGLGLSIYDRNSNRKSLNYRYPNFDNLEIFPSLPYSKTGQVYKDYLVSINVNTIKKSKTMFSRRLVEILACGGIAVTNSSLAVDSMFKDYCYIVDNKEEMLALFKRLKNGPKSEDLQRAKAGADYVAKHHTWSHRLQEINRIIGLDI